MKIKILILTTFSLVLLSACQNNELKDNVQTNVLESDSKPVATAAEPAQAETLAPSLDPEAEKQTETASELPAEGSPEIPAEEAVIETPYYEETPQYLPYKKETYQNLRNNKPMALFFHASWCEICQKLEKEIKAEINNFPNGTKIIQVDFDREKEIRLAYDIVYQATVVIIDKDGVIQTYLQSPSLEELQEAIKASL